MRVRLIDGAHPDVELNIVMHIPNTTMERTLLFNRYRPDTLELGFDEADLTADAWAN